MKGLYQQVLAQNKSKGLHQVDEIVSNSGLLSAIKNKLQYLGYDISNLSDRGVSILFCALVDIVCVVKGNSFYFATFSQSHIKELVKYNRIMPRTDEVNYERTNAILESNTISTINQYLLQKKFHFIRLNMLEECKTHCFMASIGTMNPYPTLDNEQVYSLTDLSAWHAELYNILITGCYKLKLTNSEEICQSYLSPYKSIPTSGAIITRNVSNTVIEIPLWEIKDYQHYAKDELTMKLLRGVVKYDGKLVTLNREVLEKYYGKQLYTSFESIGVRRRYALEELLSIGQKYSVAYYVNKYALNIYDCENISQLTERLRDLVGVTDTDNKSIHARILYSAEALKAGHKSFYLTIGLNSVGNHTIEEVENITSVLPRKFTFYGISHEFGYCSVDIKATSDSLAIKYGETEFKRQFGECIHFCSLVQEDTLIKGKPLFNISIKSQRNLCQNIMYGYRDNFKGYAKIVRDICKKNGITDVSDEYIQFLYINQLARVYKDAGSVKLEDVILHLIDFMCNISDFGTAEIKLQEQYEKIAFNIAKKEYEKINATAPTYNGYYIEDTPDGQYIKTDYGVYKVTDKGLSKKISLYFKGKYLGNKVIKG